MEQKTLLNPPLEIQEEIKPLSCKYHLYAKEDDFIDVVIKKTGEIVKRCRMCERFKADNKKLATLEYQREKENVTEYYVRRLLSRGKGSMPMHEYPKELVEVKQATVKLKRAIDKINEPIKVCDKHGDLFKDDVIKAGKFSSGNQRYRCKKCMKEIHQKHYDLHKIKVLAKHNAYKKENPERAKETKRKSYLKHKHKYLEKENARRARFKKLNPEKYHEFERKSVDELSDRYVKKTITKRTTLRNADIPNELVECVRAVMKLRRSLKKSRSEEKFIKLKEKEDVER